MIKQIINAIAKKRPIFLSESFSCSTNKFGGKTALVIGGGSGIGYAISHALVDSGAKVIVAGRRDFSETGFSFFQWDVSDICSIEEKTNKLIHEFGSIDMVVNSQGICPNNDFFKKYYDIDFKSFEEVMRTNLESVYFICQCFCKYFQKNKIHGHILNICSTEGIKGSEVPYGLSKAAVISLTKGLGKKMASSGIVINGIAPGATATSMMNMNSNSNLRLNYIPSQRATTPKEIAQGALLLLGDEGNQICGQVLVIDGGESL